MESGSVREGGVDKWWFVPLDPLNKTEDIKTFSTDQPRDTGERAIQMMADYKRSVFEVARETAPFQDEDIAMSLWGATGPALINRIVAAGGIKPPETWQRVTSKQIWQEHRDQLVTGEVPIALPVQSYADIKTRLTLWANKESRPIIVVTDDLETEKSIARSYVHAMSHQPDGFGFVLSSHHWGDHAKRNFLQLDHASPDISFYLQGSIEGRPEWREKNIIFVQDLGKVHRGGMGGGVEDVANLLTNLVQEGYRGGRVGMLATMKTFDFITWQTNPDRHQGRLMDKALFVFGPPLDYDQPSQIGRTLGKKWRLKPENLSLNLMGIGQRELGFVDQLNGSLTKYWTLG